MQTIDNKGLACPQPVINTKKALDELAMGTLISIVDNKAAQKNVTKLAKKLGCNVFTEEKDGNYHLTITKGENSQPQGEVVLKGCEVTTTGGTVVFCTSDKFGEGSDELSNVLIKGFFYAFTEHPVAPKAIILMNSGINLSIKGSPVLDSLKKLAEMGTEILSCGTCLDYYNKNDDLAVGEITNMYTATEILAEADRVIKP